MHKLYKIYACLNVCTNDTKIIQLSKIISGILELNKKLIYSFCQRFLEMYHTLSNDNTLYIQSVIIQ